ncbi:MAG: hypothetical protein D6746_00750 [Bacteroidetes bacterium]|nr:MAG: hypothetical protein D6746_00750 [Bacteroidota bacterium]
MRKGTGRLRRLGRLLPVLALLATTAGAQAPSFSVRGYAKNLALRSQSFFTKDPLFLDLTRLRLQGLADGPRWHGELWLDTEALTGDFLTSPDYAFGQARERTTLTDLDWTLLERRRLVVRQQLFRAFVTVYAGRAQLTLGRQRVAWGTGFVWNPTDLLNPVDPTAIEREEKAGVDAAYGALTLGALSRLEAVVAPGRRHGQTSVAARLSGTIGEYDLALMGGRFRRSWVLGGDFAGYVGDGGLRGEAALTFPDAGRAYLRATLNADYNFAGGYYVFVELHHNGPGTRDRRRYDVGALLEGVLFNVAREYAAASVSKSLSPLVAFNLYALQNLNDGSGLAGPALVWSAAENLEVSASAYVFYGPGDTEFGALENVYFGAVQFFF